MERELLIKDLAAKANELRRQTLKVIHNAGSGHSGGSLSVLDILATLYYSEMRVDPNNPDWEDRDRFVLSKGHACPALFCVLADRGFFPKKELEYQRQAGALLQGSTTRTVPGVEMSTGSLGQGISSAVGMALGARYTKRDVRVYAIVGDGESAEGQVWEAAMSAAHFKLGKLTAILDYNKLQGDASVADTMGMEPIVDKWKAFGWEVIEIDGHDYNQILDAFDTAKKSTDTPTKIIAHTTKGKGVSFMENQIKWHGSGAPNAEQLEQALADLA